MKKVIGIIGLGKMGQNITLNLLEKKYEVVVYNRSPDKIKKMQKQGAIPSYSVKEFSEKLPQQKIILMMLTAGKPVDESIKNLLPFLSKNDIIIDGGNSFYKDSIKRCNFLKNKGIDFIDMGTSGGLEGARSGASLTIGGDKEVFEKIEYLFKDIAAKDGCVYFGPSGAGHFTKMVHNGIEYAMLEAYAEGFELLRKCPYKLKLKEVAKVWNNSSIIRSYITELIEKILKKDSSLKNTKGIIGGGETGIWAYKTAKKFNLDFKTLEHALKKRKLSEKKQTFGTKLISALRHEFGGHEIK